MPRQREQVRCPECGWVGVTRQGRARFAIFIVTTTLALLLIALEWIGVLALGDLVWVIALTLMLVSIGLRMLVRGDRCGECGGPVSYR